MVVRWYSRPSAVFALDMFCEAQLYAYSYDVYSYGRNSAILAFAACTSR